VCPRLSAYPSPASFTCTPATTEGSSFKNQSKVQTEERFLRPFLNPDFREGADDGAACGEDWPRVDLNISYKLGFQKIEHLEVMRGNGGLDRLSGACAFTEQHAHMMHACMLTYVHTYIHTYMCAYMLTFLHTYIFLYEKESDEAIHPSQCDLIWTISAT